MKLLEPNTFLKGVSVEGVVTSVDPDKLKWDGVDCASYYGGTSLETAARVDFIQVKYSTSNPEMKWTLARLTHNSSKKGNNSAIRRLAETYTSAICRLRPEAEIVIRFVSNQNLTNEVKQLLNDRWVGPLSKSKLSPNSKTSHKELIKASGLNENDYQSFLEKLNFDECGMHTRFSIEEKLIQTISGLKGGNSFTEFYELQKKVRELMLPEAIGNIVTLERLLTWFGVTNKGALFPCPPDVKIPDHFVNREVSSKVVEKLHAGERLVLIHGGGGCGKTTLLIQISSLLPKESVHVFFDCFGSGKYIFSDDQRHLPEKAFLQLTNDLSVSLNMPLFLSQDKSNPATIGIFITRLTLAGQILKKMHPDAILLVSLDAVDNSITAAANTTTGQHSFVIEVLNANLTSLPGNIHFLMTCRTSFVSEFSNFQSVSSTVECPPFTLPETTEHLKLFYKKQEFSQINQFHFLTYGNPRVQTYAITNSKGDFKKLLDSLRPKGKTLPDVLRSVFKSAQIKIGDAKKFNLIVGILSCLPLPVPLVSFGRIININPELLKDFVFDLMPGLKLTKDGILISDADYEDYIKKEGLVRRSEFLSIIANDFLNNYKNEVYSSLFVDEILLQANRAQEILGIIEQDEHVRAIQDPILKKQIRLKRLKHSIAACKDSGFIINALKTLILSAEAQGKGDKLNRIFENEIDLSINFATHSVTKLIANNPEKKEKQGSYLAQDALRAKRIGDYGTAIEQLHFHDAWIQTRQELEISKRINWEISPRDIAARIEILFTLRGADSALYEILRWSPKSIAVSSLEILISELISANRISETFDLFRSSKTQKPWDLLIAIPLAIAGEKINKEDLAGSLLKIHPQFIPNAESLDLSNPGTDWSITLIDTFITACELAYSLGIEINIVQTVVKTIILSIEGVKGKKLYSFSIHRLDALLRCWVLQRVVQNRPTTEIEFSEYVFSSKSRPGVLVHSVNEHKIIDHGQSFYDHSEIESLKSKIRVLFPIYSARVDILSHKRRRQDLTEIQFIEKVLTGHQYTSFELDYHYPKYMETAALSLLKLLMIDFIKPELLLEKAQQLISFRGKEAEIESQISLFNIYRLRKRDSDEIVKFASNASSILKPKKIASSQKIDTLVKLSRLIFPISYSDSKAIFIETVAISEEIDPDVFDQIKIAKFFGNPDFKLRQPTHKQLAANFTNFISEAAIRCTNYEGFPWVSAIEVLTYLDELAVLGTISKWADEGILKLNIGLNAFLIKAVELDILSSEEIISLSLVTGEIDNDLLSSLISIVKKNPAKYFKVIEELSKDTLLLNPAPSRFDLGNEILSQIGRLHGPEFVWTKRLIDFVDFYRPILDNKENESNADQKKKGQFFEPSYFQTKFQFEPEGSSFVSSDLIETIFKEAEKSGQRVDSCDILLKMKNASSQPNNKVQFLGAISGVEQGIFRRYYFADFLFQTLCDWREFPSVKHWCKDSLPGVIENHFNAIAGFIYFNQTVLPSLLAFSDLDQRSWIHTILTGIEKSYSTLDKQTLYGVIREISGKLVPTESSEMMEWYIKHLCNKAPKTTEELNPVGKPHFMKESVSRFLYAQMSDIDTRVRWKAAHSLRRFARLGCYDIIDGIASQYNRESDNEYRDPLSPFYFLASKLWLVTSFYRISIETPQALHNQRKFLLEIALSSDLPHLGIREYAKKTLFQLFNHKVLELNSAEQKELRRINEPKKGKTNYCNESLNSFEALSKIETKFKFNKIDTLHYWYADLLGIFPRANPETILKSAENWILNKWKAFPEASYWKNEPRKNRYLEWEHYLWSNYHGAFPVIEHYGTHLEWNALYCVAGELLELEPISTEKKFSHRSFPIFLQRLIPSNTKLWASDLRGSTPLELRFFQNDIRSDQDWANNMGLEEALSEIGVTGQINKGFIYVFAEYTIHYPNRESTIEINSRLIQRNNPSAYSKGQQSPKKNHKSGLKLNEPHDSPAKSQLSLKMWYSEMEPDCDFCKHDPFKYDLEHIWVKPSQEIIDDLNLIESNESPGSWIDKANSEIVFRYESWCDEPEPDRNFHSSRIRSSGWRLGIKSSHLKIILSKRDVDLHIEVQNTRQLNPESRTPYEFDKNSVEHTKIIFLKKEGKMYCKNNNIGTW